MSKQRLPKLLYFRENTSPDGTHDLTETKDIDGQPRAARSANGRTALDACGMSTCAPGALHLCACGISGLAAATPSNSVGCRGTIARRGYDKVYLNLTLSTHRHPPARFFQSSRSDGGLVNTLLSMTQAAGGWRRMSCQAPCRLRVRGDCADASVFTQTIEAGCSMLHE